MSALLLMVVLSGGQFPSATDLDCEYLFLLSMRTVTATCEPSEPILIGPPTQERTAKETQRVDILREGWVWPNPLTPESGASDYEHTAPGAILSLRVVRMCCHYGPDIPLPEWWCRWPDGPPLSLY